MRPTPGPGAVGAAGAAVTRRTGAVLSRSEVEAALRADGLTPHSWSNGAGVLYAPHAHQYRKVLYCVTGSIVFHTDDGDMALGPGDRLELAPGVEHAATVGNAGVQCVEAPVT